MYGISIINFVVSPGDGLLDHAVAVQSDSSSFFFSNLVNRFIFYFNFKYTQKNVTLYSVKFEI